ncbi:MAG: transglutaminase domain-containing protein [Defluviitaleaceae bacterium]|nr:transglutaminase domain-containing protein [Defluviitaleaceae bacterium]
MKKMKKIRIAIVAALSVFAMGLVFHLNSIETITAFSGIDVPLNTAKNSGALTAQSTVLTNVASGRDVNRNARGEIDFSNANDGYVMARWLVPSATDIRVVIIGPNGTQYQYRLSTAGDWESFPLTGGNGSYTVRIAEAVGDGRFSVTNNVNIDLVLRNEFAPFLRPNQFVNFNAQSTAVSLARMLTAVATSDLDSVSRVYNWVVDNITYDFDLAQNVQSGYVPDLEAVLERRRGICFDYASLMTAMLRSQGIPTRLAIGYVGDVRHAWISVFTREHGWVNDLIQFDGNDWRLMDPTFSATGGSVEAARFVGTGGNHRQTHLH